MLRIEDVTTLDEGVVFLSHANNDKNKLTLHEIDLAIKTHGQKGMRNCYFNYVKMIIDKLDDAYILLAPLIIMNPKTDELSEKAKSLMSEVKAYTKDFKIEYHTHVEEHPQALYVAFYLLKNYVFPDMYLGFNRGVI